MKHARLLLLVVPVVSSSLEHGLAAQAAQGPGELSAKLVMAEVDASKEWVVLEGQVLAPDGTPSEGAVVVSSAGGRAVTDSTGSYRLEVQVPLEASTMQVTAVGIAEANLAACTSVSLSRPAQAPILLPPLQLAVGASCSPSWLPTFGSEPGTNGPIDALVVWDDGNGPALYAGGSFFQAGGEPAVRIVKWDGSSWSALGSGMNNEVNDLEVFDDGSGPALYALGGFTTAGGVPANRIAKWDGSSWSALGSGVNNSVRALKVYDDGNGPALYAAGFFTTAGGVPANRIARWDGTSWSRLGFGLNNNVHSLTVFDDGSGSALCAGGDFTTAGGVLAKSVAKWDGESWSALGSGLSGLRGFSVAALEGYDDGSGPALYAGGGFTNASGLNISKWDGAAWLALSSGMNNSVLALQVWDDGGGTSLYAGGAFTGVGGVAEPNFIASWDGASWTALGSGMNDFVHALEVFDDGSGSALYAGGEFTSAGGVTATSIAKWQNLTWEPLGGFVNNQVFALKVHDDGSGPALYAAGGFTTAGGLVVNRVARWNGMTWSALGSGMNDVVWALVVWDDGSGPALYAGGSFTTAGGVSANRIAKWDGTSWSALGSGINGIFVRALTVHDDGSGSALFAGGLFTTAGGVPANGIARWDGTSWSALRSGLNGLVYALTVHDDGSGNALYVGGDFTIAGAVAANRIARWDGTGWSALGGGMNSFVSVLAPFDDGTGPALYAGGNFSRALDSGDSFLAKWGCPGPSTPTTYCTGKTTSAGCVPFLSHSGTPSATTGPFNVLSNDHLEGEIGVYLYSFQKANLNFHGGKLCVKAPIHRVAGLIKATDGIACTSCAGNCRTFKRNFNALIQSGTDPLLTPGQSVKVQAHQRDPLDLFADNLSNGIAFVIGP